MDVIVIAGGDELYRDVYQGEVHNPDTALLDVSTLTTAEVDVNGYLKPGLPLALGTGNILTLITAGSTPVYTVVPYPVKLRQRTNNTTPALSGDTNDLHIAAPLIGQVSRKAMEFNLGRALSANEIAGFALGGCKIQLQP